MLAGGMSGRNDSAQEDAAAQQVKPQLPQALLLPQHGAKCMHAQCSECTAPLARGLLP